MERFIRLQQILLLRKVGERADRLVQESRGSCSHTMTLFILGREMLEERREKGRQENE